MNKSSPRAIRTRSVISLRPYLVINLRDVFTAAETFFISLSVPLILLDDATVCKEMRILLPLLIHLFSSHLIHALSLHFSVIGMQEFALIQSNPQ